MNYFLGQPIKQVGSQESRIRPSYLQGNFYFQQLKITWV